MKVKISTQFSAKVQATQFNPVEQTDNIEIEMDVKDDADLEVQYEKLQKFIRGKVINSVMEGVKEIRVERANLLNELAD